jgi:cyclic pyranopterin phosphate synthase
MESNFTHFDKNGNAVMVDVSDKIETSRTATAKGSIKVNEIILDKIVNKTIEKGDVLGVARVAGIMGAKKTSDLIPMCHPLMLTKVSIDYEIEKESKRITVICRVKTSGKTGVEMEALTGVMTCLLTIYDMCKAIDKSMEIMDVYLAKKTGGKSGEYYNTKVK